MITPLLKYNSNFDSLQKVLIEEFNITSTLTSILTLSFKISFAGVNDQLKYFIKTLNLAK